MFRNLIKFVSIIFLGTTPMLSYTNSKKTSKLIYVLSVEGTANPEYFKNFVTKVTGNHTKFDLSTEIIKKMPPNVISFLSVTLNPRAGYRRRPLIQHEFLLCDMYNSRNFQMASYLTSWLNDYINSANIPRDCPMPKGNYSWRDVSFDRLNIPSYFPSAKYEIKSGSYLRQKSKNITFTQVGVLLKVD